MATPLASDYRMQYQYDILWNPMGDNTLLPFSGVSTLNMQLNTNNKSMIKAINEMLILLNTNNTSVTNFTNSFNTYIGNPQVDTTTWSNIQSIDTNIMKALWKTYQLASGGGGTGGTVTVIDGGTF